MHDFLLRYIAVTWDINILGLALLVLFGFLPLDLCLFKYLCDGLSLLLPLRTDHLLLLLPYREVACDYHGLRCGIQH